MKRTVVFRRKWGNGEIDKREPFKRYFQSSLTYLKCHCKYTTLNFLKFICEHFDARTNYHLFYKSAFLVFFFFKIMLESWGCGLYTSAAYTRFFTVNIYLFGLQSYLVGFQAKGGEISQRMMNCWEAPHLTLDQL